MSTFPRRAENGERNLASRVLIGFFKVFGTILMIGLVTGVMLACIFAIYVKNYINTDIGVNVDDFTLDQTSFIYTYDKTVGDYVATNEIYSSENRVWVSYEEVPSYVFDALIAIEDERFWSHNGVDWFRTAGAFVNMFLGMRDTFGGSTITQQVVKNLTGEKEVTVRRKLTEIFSALEFEREYSKEDILEIYINLVYFSQGCYGIESAANKYFGKSASELTLPEAASIVGITNLPTYYDPYINRDNNKYRQTVILNKMYELGMIETEEELNAALEAKLEFKRDAETTNDADSTTEYQSYFVDQIIRDVTADLAEALGVDSRVASRMLYSGGYQIYSTMDQDIQAIIDEVYTNEEYWPKLRNEDSLEDEPQSSIVVMDPYTGNIVGMYGSLGEKTGNLTLNRATQSKRSPGSSIKPISVYAAAIEAGLINPYSVYTDMPAMVLNGGAYPKNYDRVYRGQITIMEAVQRSSNTIPVQLVLKMTPEYCYNFAKYTMGLESLVDNVEVNGEIKGDDTLSAMALGGTTYGVTAVELAAAYSVFVNEGIYTEPRTYSKVLDSNGNVILDNTTEGIAVIKPTTAYYMNALLTNVITNGTGYNARLSNSVAAGKTGTTDDDYDRWFVGYTPYYSCAVWYGFDSNTTIVTQSGTSPAIPLWQAVMEKIHEDLEPRSFFTPTGVELVQASYCVDSGMAPTEACRADIRGSRVRTGTFVSSDVPVSACTMHQYVDIDSTTKQIATPYCPAENITRVSMLQLDRRFPIAGIVLNDEQYTIREFGVDYNVETETGFRVRYAANLATSAVNAFCQNHLEPLPEEPEDPDDIIPPDGEFPTEPDDPTVTESPPGADPTPSGSPEVTSSPNTPPPVESTPPPTEPSVSEPPVSEPSASPSPEFPTEPTE